MSEDKKEQEVNENEEIEEQDGLAALEQEEDQEGESELEEPSNNLMADLPIEKRMAAFVQGEITLADLYGLPHEELYDIAEYGQMLYKQGKYDDAETIFYALTALEPYDENFHAALGAVYQRQKKTDEAIIEYDRALQCNEFLLVALVNRAELHLEKGMFEEVASALQRVFELEPEGRKPYTQRAQGLAAAIASMVEELAKQKEESEGAPE